MYYYRIHGMNVASDHRMRAAYTIPEFSEEERDVFIHEGALDERLTTETEEEQKKGYGFFYRYEKTRGWVRAVGNGCFLMQNGNEVIYRLKESHDPLIVDEVILCLCLSVIIIQKEKLIIHGSALSWGNKAVIISGHSGSGKSTLTEVMLRNGGAFMSDDLTAVAIEEGKAYVYPGYPQQKLTVDAVKAGKLDTSKLIQLPKDSGEEKYARSLKERYCCEKKELHAMIVLQIQEVETATIKAITGNEKLKYFLNNLYKRNTYKMVGFTKQEFTESVQISNQIELYELIRPQEKMTIEEVATMVGRVVDQI